jgi:serine/threonine-protein kinase
LLRRFDGPKNLDESIALFERAIASDAAYAPAHAAIAWAYTRQAAETRDKTWSTRAVDAARHAVSLDPFLADAHASLGLALVAAGDHQSVETALREAEGLDPRNGLMWFARGELAYAQDRRTDATAAYQKAIEQMPDDWRSLTGIGTVAYRDGRYDDAIGWYTRAAKLAPDVATAHALVGAAYVMKGDFAGAAAALQKSISIRPTASAYTNLGTALFLEGRYRDSVAAFEKGVELRPADPLMWGNLGEARRWTAGGRERAAEAYLRATQLVEQQLSRDPTNVRDRSRLALYLSKRGEAQASLGELAKISDLASRDLDTLYRAAVTYELTGNRSEALRWLGLALEQHTRTRRRPRVGLPAWRRQIPAARHQVRAPRRTIGNSRSALPPASTSHSGS